MNTFDGRDKKPDKMRIFFAGTGGQGVIFASRVLTDVFVKQGHDVVSSQTHGMAQRGGSVVSSVLVHCGISPVCPLGSADLVIGFEPLETVRILQLMSSKTNVVINTVPIVPYVISQQYIQGQDDAKYPPVEGLLESVRRVTPYLFTASATKLASRAGSANSLNVVMLGYALGLGLLPFSEDEFLAKVLENATPKSRQINEKAFKTGVKYGLESRLAVNAV